VLIVSNCSKILMRGEVEWRMTSSRGQASIAILSLAFIAILWGIIALKTIVFTHRAGKQLDALPDDDRESIMAGLAAYAMSGRGDAKMLSGRDGFRLRIGRYRFLFDEDASTVLAFYVGKRDTTTYERN